MVLWMTFPVLPSSSCRIWIAITIYVLVCLCTIFVLNIHPQFDSYLGAISTSSELLDRMFNSWIIWTA